MNLSTKQKHTHRLRERTYGYQEGSDSYGVWDWHMHTAVFKMDNPQDLLYSTGNSAQYIYIFLKINLFIYYWLRWVVIAVHRLSLVVVSWGYSSLWCMGFSLWWLLLLRSIGSRCVGFSSCGIRALLLWCTGLAAPRHVGSSWTGVWTYVPCIGRQLLNHCTTREVPELCSILCNNLNVKRIGKK